FRRGRKRLLAIFSLGHLVIVGCQQIAHDLPIVLLVLDHQNSLAHAGLACSLTVTGSVNAKVEPCPNVDSTQIFPPCISIMRFEIASPSPVPPFWRVIELSAC